MPRKVRSFEPSVCGSSGVSAAVGGVDDDMVGLSRRLSVWTPQPWMSVAVAAAVTCSAYPGAGRKTKKAAAEVEQDAEAILCR